MKQAVLFAITVFSLLLLAGCMMQREYYPSQMALVPFESGWVKQISINPEEWRQRGGKWFVTGEASYPPHMPINNPLTAIRAAVSDHFDKIYVSANVIVQIESCQDHNSVSIVGPNSIARSVSVRVVQNTLYIEQDAGAPPGCPPTIVHVTIHCLHQLTQAGNGTILGRNILSDRLSLFSYGAGNIYLAGDMNLNVIEQSGPNVISILGAYTPCLKIRTASNGSIYMTGRVGVKSIAKWGCGEIQILGVQSNGLSIFSSGSGCITLLGQAAVCQINAMRRGHVLLYWVNGNNTAVNLRDHAFVGLAGTTDQLHVMAEGSAAFDGQYLKSRHAFVKTIDYAHANVAASQSAFATATTSSSIYFFGPPNILSSYASGGSHILPIWDSAAQSTRTVVTTSQPWNNPNDPGWRTTHGCKTKNKSTNRGKHKTCRG